MTPVEDTIHVDAEEARAAVEAGGDAAPLEPAPASPATDLGLLERNPVIAAALAIAAPIAAAFVEAVLDGATLRAAGAAAAAALLAAATAWARGRVTPIADAKLGPGLPLVLDPATPEPPPAPDPDPYQDPQGGLAAR